MEQSTDQSRPQHWWQGKRGVSGNPSGMTRTRLRAMELFDEFRARHTREPTAGEAVQLRLAAKLAAKFERSRGEDEDLARMAGHLNRTLAKLGLDAAKPRAAPPLPSALDYVEKRK
jgi:hypothetical protein